MGKYFDSPQLIKDIPINRAAYSDRTAWLMAEMSRLVYEPIPGEATIEELSNDLRAAIKSGDYEKELKGMVKGTLKLRGKNYDIIENELGDNNFELISTFVKNDTEAFLVKLRDPDCPPFLVLAFRGTASIKDAFTDANAVLMEHPDGGRVHSGFYKAYCEVKDQIEKTLEDYKELPLYITGHSLGGALAMLATKHVGANSTGATYTFGAPRAADDDFYKRIKTPIYRVVNAADAVPRLPFGFGLNFAVAFIRFIPINYSKVVSEMIRKYFSGYTHEGNLIFLSAADKTEDEEGIPYANLRVEASPHYLWRATVVIKQLIKTAWRAAATDHFKDGYSEKLKANALRRR